MFLHIKQININMTKVKNVVMSARNSEIIIHWCKNHGDLNYRKKKLLEHVKTLLESNGFSEKSLLGRWMHLGASMKIKRWINSSNNEVTVVQRWDSSGLLHFVSLSVKWDLALKNNKTINSLAEWMRSPEINNFADNEKAIPSIKLIKPKNDYEPRNLQFAYTVSDIHNLEIAELTFMKNLFKVIKKQGFKKRKHETVWTKKGYELETHSKRFPERHHSNKFESEQFDKLGPHFTLYLKYPPELTKDLQFNKILEWIRNMTVAKIVNITT